jgi:hypothetical protein
MDLRFLFSRRDFFAVIPAKAGVHFAFRGRVEDQNGSLLSPGRR